MERALDIARRESGPAGLTLLIELLRDSEHELSMNDRECLVDFLKNGRNRPPGALPLSDRTIFQRMRDLDRKQRHNAKAEGSVMLYWYIKYRQRRYKHRVRGGKGGREILVDRIAAKERHGDRSAILNRLSDPKKYGLERPNFADRFE